MIAMIVTVITNYVRTLAHVINVPNVPDKENLNMRT